MPPLSRSAFGSGLRRLSPGERAALVADIWAARGWETRVEGGRIPVDDQHVPPVRESVGGRQVGDAGTDDDVPCHAAGYDPAVKSPSQRDLSRSPVSPGVTDRSESGKVFGVPYNFERPSLGRMLSAYWQPGEGMLVRKPFGVGYTLNLASWRSWAVLLVAGGLLWHERKGGDVPGTEEDEEEDEGPVEVVVD